MIWRWEIRASWFYSPIIIPHFRCWHHFWHLLHQIRWSEWILFKSYSRVSKIAEALFFSVNINDELSLWRCLFEWPICSNKNETRIVHQKWKGDVVLYPWLHSIHCKTWKQVIKLSCCLVPKSSLSLLPSFRLFDSWCRNSKGTLSLMIVFRLYVQRNLSCNLVGLQRLSFWSDAFLLQINSRIDDNFHVWFLSTKLGL